MMDNTIYFKIGAENKPVVETSGFRNSIFINQYRTALDIVSRYIKNSSKSAIERYDAFQGLAFCGERGDGKTSAMLSFINILKVADAKCSLSEKDIIERKQLIEELLGKNSPIINKRFAILDLIDPTQFTNYNIIEVILSQLFNQINILRSEMKKAGHNILNFNEIFIEFQAIKRSIEQLCKGKDSIFDALEDFNELSDIIKLKSRIHSLILEFLAICNATHLIIPIDDVDLQMSGVYEMVEKLRKYFALPEVIVVMAVKPNQLSSAVEHALRKSVEHDDKSFSESELEIMTEKYLVKFLPQNCRIQMPGVESIFDRKFVVLDNADDKVVYRNETFKDGVLELIFMKTRYLFYNSLGEISTLFPNNMRELFQLVGLVADMKLPQNNGDDTHRLNQWNFKNYLFGVWTESLTKEYRVKATEWSGNISDYTLNKDVVSFLESRFNKYLSRNEDNKYKQDEKGIAKNHQTIKDSILSPDNYSYNVSIGDVFYILDIIDKEILPDPDYKFIFFIRSLYSIKLYDKYDYITHHNQVFLQDRPSGGIYRNDERFSNVNLLQRLVGGSYFTFAPNEYIMFQESEIPCDRRIIKGKDGLNLLIDKVVSDEAANLTMMRMAEFFILTVSHYVSSKEKMSTNNMQTYPVEYMAEARKGSEPIPFSRFTSQRGYYEFNLLAPFANIVNIKYAYERFPKGDILFNLAIKNKESLLCKMWKCSCISRGKSEEEWNKLYDSTLERISKTTDLERDEILSDAMGIMLSDGIVRNAEVMVALSDRFKHIVKEISRAGTDQTKTKEAKIIIKLRDFYNKISSPASAMTTHRFIFKDDDTADDDYKHRISFQYFNVISEFLSEIENLSSAADNDPLKDSFNLFFDIYDVMDSTGENNSTDNSKLISELRRIIGRIFDVAESDNPTDKSGKDLFSWVYSMDPDSKDRSAIIAALEDIDNTSSYDLPNDRVKQAAWKDRMKSIPEKWQLVLKHQAVDKYLKSYDGQH